eukprot:9152777-Pyramimonas_sp.AAC.1
MRGGEGGGRRMRKRMRRRRRVARPPKPPPSIVARTSWAPVFFTLRRRALGSLGEDGKHGRPRHAGQVVGVGSGDLGRGL